MQALADLDDNGDGIIDHQDRAFGELKVWQDKNGDGVSASDELMTLAEVGIERIDLNNKETVGTKVDGGIIKEQAKFIKTDGSVHTLADVNFEADSIHTRYLNKVELSDAVKDLPSVYGMGRLDDIQQSAMKSSELAGILERYSKTTSRTVQKALLDELMIAWAKTDPQYSDASIKIMKQENIRWVEASDTGNMRFSSGSGGTGAGMVSADSLSEPNLNLNSGASGLASAADIPVHVIRLTPNQSLPSYMSAEPTPPEVADKTLENKVKFVDAIMGISPTEYLYEINRS